ncbi:single-stranded DNA-binding protein [Marinobacterium nitratireducens]|uniref:Single-stranded DNA-binding protein n=1 Tax=Marinobacterium nitratireducens TaxID=518897 RepID=A0A917ZPY8_9GAMM|nr:single-stranded DNA-binding protein [Marinobacterium nitratireducens]GGO89193.1 single-stranded DNA-binding protein [Marinobacterium nitratireducens]
MANDLNLCQFIGRLGADPEIRFLPSGEPVANMRIACSESWKNKQTGQKDERTEWVSLVMFGSLASMVEKFWQKGTQVYVAGKMRTRKWSDQQGNDRYSTEVIVNQVQTLKDGRQNGQQPQGQQAPQQGYQQQPSGMDFPDDGEIPF